MNFLHEFNKDINKTGEQSNLDDIFQAIQELRNLQRRPKRLEFNDLVVGEVSAIKLLLSSKSA